MVQRSRRGQSTLEYVILVTAVIVVIITFLMGKESFFQKTLNNSLNSVSQEMTTMSGRFSDVFDPVDLQPENP